MNLELLEYFGQNYPEEFDGALDCISVAVSCSFNRHGTLLAVGCNDGRIVIWDFLTRGIAKIISAHVHPVCSLSWSRDGMHIISASTDNTVSIWETLTGECQQKYRFPSPILKVQFNPRDDQVFLVCPMKHPVVLVHVDGTHQVLPLDDENDANVVASFDHRGLHIYTGNSRGKLSVFTFIGLKLVSSCKVTAGTSSSTAIKSIEFARRGGTFLVNAADRVIRIYECSKVINAGIDSDPDPIHKLQDLVNKTTWKKCCFSPDGEYICAGSSKSHALYVWEKSIGNIVKILHGTKGELLLDVVWHPVRPIICSISSGVVSIWSQNQVENWSAFAPDFKELDENVEYDERESEFDIEDEDKSVELNPVEEREDNDVDVTTIEPIPAFCSSDEEDETDEKDLLYLPLAPEIEDPEDYTTHSYTDTADTGGQKENTEPKRKKPKTHDIELKDAPTYEVHPMVANNKNKDRQGGGSKKGRPRAGDGRKGKP